MLFVGTGDAGYANAARENEAPDSLTGAWFAPQMTITLAGAIILESAASTNGLAVAVLQQCIAGTAGT
jgi:hypothetical protein